MAKKYVGKGKKVPQYDLVNIYLRYDDLVPNDRGYVNLTVGKMRNTDDKGNTHTVWVNDYKPPIMNFPDVPVKEQPPKPLPAESFDNDGDLPF